MSGTERAITSVTTEGATTPAPSLPRLLAVWLGLAAQSFGGGTATQYLIYRAFVERRGWVSPEEFGRAWAICQLAPGINLLALTVLIGWKLGRAGGVAVSLVGLLLPSVAITVGMTALYAQVRAVPSVQAALRGVIPATVGLGLLMSWRIARPLLVESRREGRAMLLIAGGALLGSAALVAVLDAPVMLALAAGGGIAAGASWGRAASGGGAA